MTTACEFSSIAGSAVVDIPVLPYRSHLIVLFVLIRFVVRVPNPPDPNVRDGAEDDGRELFGIQNVEWRNLKLPGSVN